MSPTPPPKKNNCALTSSAPVQKTLTLPISKKAAEPSPPQPVWGHAQAPWFTQEESVVGLAHRIKNLPCQDASRSITLPRPVLVVADGAGSSVVSEIGAQAVVSATVRLLDTLDKTLATFLDHEHPNPQTEAKQWGLTVVKHGIGVLKDLAALHRREMRDFRCTLLLMVAGKKNLMWLKVGDGALVVETQQKQHTAAGLAPVWTSILNTLGEMGKGEFANQTQFLDGIAPDDVQIGILKNTQITGMAVMSDGAAERLVSNDGRTVSPRLGKLLQQLREDKLKRSALTSMFYEEGFCHASSGDDRSLALAACQVVTSLPEPQKFPEQETVTPPVAPPEIQAVPSVVKETKRGCKKKLGTKAKKPKPKKPSWRLAR